MDLSLFLQDMIANPALLVMTVLVLGVIFVNGWTDAPNAIATCVSTRAMGPRAAVLMAAVFNFFGVLVMTLINKKVAFTIANMVDFGKVSTGNSNPALIALCAALFAIVIWATAAWVFGIPTSESHALIAGLSGSAIAMGGFSGINGAEWMKVIYGLGLSTLLGFAAGYGVVKLVEVIFRPMSRKTSNGFFTKAQIFGGAGMAFMHGAQDGQKFLGVFILGTFIAKGQGDVGMEQFNNISMWMIVMVSLVMGIGTSIGGYRIIKAVGMDMVKLRKYQGFSADLAASGCLLLSSLTGIPVSTTHTKTTAIMGVGFAKSRRAVKWAVVKDMVLTWVLTFPGCGFIAYVVTLIADKVF